MKKLMAAVIALTSASLAYAADPVPGGSIAVGEKLATSVCAACHGSDGNSTSAQIPRLAGQNAKYIYKQLNDFKSGRRQNVIMTAQASALSQFQMASVALFFATKQSQITLANPATLAFGEKIYRGGKLANGVVPCAGCHGPAGKGNPFAAFPKIGGQQTDYLKAQLYAFRAAGRGDLTGTKRNNDGAKPTEPGMMQMVASKLSDQDIEYLTNFLGGLH